MKNKYNIEIYKVICLDCDLVGELAYWNKDVTCPSCKKPMLPEKKAERILKYRYYKEKLLDLIAFRGLFSSSTYENKGLFSYAFHLFSGFFITLYLYPIHRPEPIFIALGLLLFMKYYTCPDDKPNVTLFGALLAILVGFMLKL